MAAVHEASKGYSKEAALLINGEANITQLCSMFGLTNKTVQLKLRGVQPSRSIGRGIFYSIKEVGPYLIKPAYDINEYIRRMDPSDLPKMLTKEFWAGQRSRQLFMKEAGDLWPTDYVLKEVGEAFKMIAMQIRLMQDAVERETELSEVQRKILTDLIAGTMQSIQVMLTTKFAERPERDDLKKLMEAGGVVDDDEDLPEEAGATQAEYADDDDEL